MRFLSRIALALVCFSLSISAYAVRVSSIYQADIPVASQAPDQKLQAEQDGLSLVFIKVSGNPEVLSTYPNLKASLKHADTFVKEYSYVTKPKGNTTQTILSLRFDSDAVNRLLTDVGSSIWGENRPLILVLMNLDSPSHPVDVVDASNSDLQTAFKQAGKLRGLPMIFPLMDMKDMSQISVNDIRQQNIDTLEKAAGRYQTNVLLLGEIKQSPTKVDSAWTFVNDQGQTETWHFQSSNVPAIFSEVVKHIADQMVAEYSSTESTAETSELKLKILGVKQQSDLMQVMKSLQGMTQVSDVQLASIEGQDILLTVYLKSSKQNFEKALSIGKKFILQNSVQADDSLAYQWIP